MKPKPLPPTTYLTACFNYDPETGHVFWKHRPREHFASDDAWRQFTCGFAGKIAGCKFYSTSDAPLGIRIRMTVSGVVSAFFAHRIIYQLMGVDIPDGIEVDHKNTDPFDNRWCNLRLATTSQNHANRRKFSGSLPKGVSRQKGKFRAAITHNNHKINIGTFATPEEAHSAYRAKATEIYGEFARFN